MWQLLTITRSNRRIEFQSSFLDIENIESNSMSMSVQTISPQLKSYGEQ